jgi:ABC-type branched-subunit amino acid transport system substrate-binding protein
MSRFTCACVTLLAACGSSGPVRTFGALVPLTGALADEGPHIEQAFKLAGAQLNGAGGVAGRQLHISLRDTRSDPTRGLAAAEELLTDTELLGLLGPEEDDIARGLLPTLKRLQLPTVSGGVISTVFSSATDDQGLVFRTDPSAQVLGGALARRIIDDGNTRVAILFVANEYGRNLSGVVANELNGVVEVVAPGFGFQGPYPVNADMPSYDDVVAELLEPAPQAVVLVLPPATGATFVRSWSLAGSQGRLYFAPSLRTDSFVQSLPPGVVDGMIGVSAALGPDSAAFAEAFAHSWYGTRPRREAAFAYDGLALLSLAAEAAAHAGGGEPTHAEIARQLPLVSGPPGEVVRWNELDKGLERVRAGVDIDYQGASGTVDLNAGGDAPAAAEFWTIAGHEIQLEAGQ